MGVSKNTIHNRFVFIAYISNLICAPFYYSISLPSPADIHGNCHEAFIFIGQQRSIMLINISLYGIYIDYNISVYLLWITLIHIICNIIISDN